MTRGDAVRLPSGYPSRSRESEELKESVIWLKKTQSWAIDVGISPAPALPAPPRDHGIAGSRDRGIARGGSSVRLRPRGGNLVHPRPRSGNPVHFSGRNPHKPATSPRKPHNIATSPPGRSTPSAPPPGVTPSAAGRVPVRFLPGRLPGTPPDKRGWRGGSLGPCGSMCRPSGGRPPEGRLTGFRPGTAG